MDIEDAIYQLWEELQQGHIIHPYIQSIGIIPSNVGDVIHVCLIREPNEDEMPIPNFYEEFMVITQIVGKTMLA